MFDWYYNMINSSTTASIIMSVAIMMLAGFLMTRITKKLKLPNVTAYIVAGIIIGPYCLNLIPSKIVSGMDFISDIALAFIAFSVGEFFKLSTLKKSGMKTIVLTLFEALMASIMVFIVTYLILGLSLPFSIILAALASATAPASTLMTIKQTKAKGEFVDTLLQVVALDDVVSLLAYSVAISISLVSLTGSGGASFNFFATIIKPILFNILSLVIGAGLGFLLKFLLKKRSTDNRLIIVLCTLFLFCGICKFLDVSPLLGCMVIGSVYINLTNDKNLFLQTNYFSPPILLLFFVKSGIGFDFSALFSSISIVGSIPLWAIGIIYFIVRIGGKYLGAFLGSLTTKRTKEIRNYLGLALIPQAGVAIGLAAMGAQAIGGDAGIALQTIILASSVLYELVGPICAKLSLYLSKSYSNNIDEIVSVEEVDEETGKAKTEVELLIEKIQEISRQVQEENIQQFIEDKKAEEAFTEVAMEQQENYFSPNQRGKNKGDKLL